MQGGNGRYVKIREAAATMALPASYTPQVLANWASCCAAWATWRAPAPILNEPWKSARPPSGPDHPTMAIFRGNLEELCSDLAVGSAGHAAAVPRQTVVVRGR
jgi:hypothetical protein